MKKYFIVLVGPFLCIVLTYFFQFNYHLFSVFLVLCLILFPRTLQDLLFISIRVCHIESKLTIDHVASLIKHIWICKPSQLISSQLSWLMSRRSQIVSIRGSIVSRVYINPHHPNHQCHRPHPLCYMVSLRLFLLLQHRTKSLSMYMLAWIVQSSRSNRLRCQIVQSLGMILMGYQWLVCQPSLGFQRQTNKPVLTVLASISDFIAPL